MPKDFKAKKSRKGVPSDRIMGLGGKAAKIKDSFFKNRPTGHKTLEETVRRGRKKT